MFHVDIEGKRVIEDLDIHAEVGHDVKLIKEVTTTITDGGLTIEIVPKIENPKLSAIEVIAASGSITPHYAHAVPSENIAGYYQVDADGNGKELIVVNGKFSHTHNPTPGAVIVSWTWSDNTRGVLGQGESLAIWFPVGVQDLFLEVKDSAGWTSSDSTKVTVADSSYPNVEAVNPNIVGVKGGQTVTIVGTSLLSAKTVKLGNVGTLCLC